MGQGAQLYVFNGTPYIWKLTQPTHEYQMNSWSFPDEILPNSFIQTYVEWDGSIGDTESDDAAEADYSIQGTSSTFQIQASYPDFKINLIGMSTLSQSQQDQIDIGFVWNEVSYPAFDGNIVIISGVDGQFICNSTNQLRVPWLQNNLPTLGSRSLRHLCLPASHDSGMSTIGYSTEFGTSLNCQAQSNDLATQLGYGIRFFDIRPVISHGDYYTGHYSDVGGILNWQGADGQKISDIVNQVNSFTNAFPELVILRITHDYDTDGSYGGFNQTQWNGLFGQLSLLKHLFTAPSGTSDLTTLSLNTFIGNNQAAVVLIIELDNGITLGDYVGKGFYDSSLFPLYDNYANTDGPNTTTGDQLQKLAAQRASPDSQVFLLNWTLTQQGSDTVLGPSLLENADMMRPRLAATLIPHCSSVVYPNLLNTDGVQDTIPVAVATAINCLITSAPS
ncbi:PLC-like phosphodiesterase [Stipitochalara longipes BDJ]|nr:PLC-like phosphodiesterase [Stipitochalara longipes BDJ]